MKIKPEPGSRFANQPTHADFWKLSEIVLDFDMVMEDARTPKEANRRMDNLINNLVDANSLVYMARQRAALMVMNSVNGKAAQEDLQYAVQLQHMIASAYCEAVTVGILLERKRNKVETDELRPGEKDLPQ